MLRLLWTANARWLFHACGLTQMLPDSYNTLLRFLTSDKLHSFHWSWFFSCVYKHSMSVVKQPFLWLKTLSSVNWWEQMYHTCSLSQEEYIIPSALKRIMLPYTSSPVIAVILIHQMLPLFCPPLHQAWYLARAGHMICMAKVWMAWSIIPFQSHPCLQLQWPHWARWPPQVCTTFTLEGQHHHQCHHSLVCIVSFFLLSWSYVLCLSASSLPSGV